MNALRDLRPEQTEADERVATETAEHIAWVAETLASMPDMATSMSATQPVAPADVPTIRRLLPTLAARYELRVRLEEENGYVTVWFDRR